MNKKCGVVYWITGLSGAGKTTIGKLLYNHIKSQGKNIVFLDGDSLREVFQNTDYTSEGRKNITFQYAKLCRMLSEQGVDVICCCVSMFDVCRSWNRENIKNYIEIYLKVAIEELIRRDQKNLYSKALNKEINNVMGIDLDFEEPKNPDLVIENNGTLTPVQIAKIILEYID